MKHVEDNIIDLGINYNKIPPHSQSLNSQLGKPIILSSHCHAKSSTPDVMGHLIAAAELGYKAQKDMSWKKALADPDHREPALKALESEMTSLQSTILTEILAGKPEYKIAVEKATPG